MPSRNNAPAARTSELDAKPSIAVLPFENLTADPENAYFTDGVQEKILSDLSKVAGLKVIGGRSVAPYRGKTLDLEKIGRELGVTHVMEGSVRRANGRVRISARLIETRTKAQSWAENYDREVSDLFAIQSEIAQKIVGELKANFSSAEKAAIEEQPTQDLAAYDSFLKARALLSTFGVLKKASEENATKAATLLASAIARDPKFTLAYCLLSDAYLSLYFNQLYNPEQLVKAREAIDAALRISPDSGQAHLVLARLCFWALHDTLRAEKELAIAAAALPGRAEVFRLAADIEEQRGKWKGALRDRRKAAELDPRDPDAASDLIESYISLRRYAEAEQELDRAIAFVPEQTSGPFLRQKSRIALCRGNAKAARAALDAHPMRKSGAAGLTLEIARAAMMDRDYAEAARLLESIEENAQGGNVLPKTGINAFARGEYLELLGTIARAQGQTEKASAAFESAHKAFETWLSENHDKAGPYDARALALMAESDAGLARKEDAIREARDVVKAWPLSRDASLAAHIATRLAVVYAWSGEHNAAIDQLTSLVKLPAGPTAGDLKLNPVWDDLRSDSRFNDLITAADEPVNVEDSEKQSVASSEPAEKSIAVLPFENLSEDKSNEYFASGIHDDVLANLSRLGQLKVISPNSVLPYKGAQRNLREIGHALGVRTLLEGNVRRAGNRVHIHVQLIDATNDAQIWAESFDREMTDLFSVQSDLAVRIAAALQVKLSPAERASIETPPTRDAEAYDFYLRGRELLHGIAGLGKREENLSTAIDLLNRAVARDPNFALGYCLLAELHLARFRVSRVANVLSSHDPADLEKVRSNLEIALRLAPDLGEAHLVRGMYFYHGVSDYQSASAEFSIARRALPNNGECFHLSGLLERRLGRWSEGLHYQIKAVSLDPQNATAREDLASTYYLNRNFAEAERVLDQAILAIPEHANFFRLKKAQVGLMKGDLEGAALLCNRFRRITNTMGWSDITAPCLLSTFVTSQKRIASWLKPWRNLDRRKQSGGCRAIGHSSRGLKATGPRRTWLFRPRSALNQRCARERPMIPECSP